MSKSSAIVLSAVVGIALLANQAHAAGSIAPRGVAKKSIEDSLTNVKKYADSDSEALSGYLLDMLAIPIGDDPRVLAACEDVLSRTNRPSNVRVVAQALHVIAKEHLRLWGRAEQKARIAAITRMTLAKGNANNDRSIQYAVPRILAALGGKYAEEAEAYYVNLLKSPIPFGESDAAKRDSVYRHVIAELIEHQRHGSYPLIREMTLKYDLLNSFKSWVAEDSSRRLKFSHNDELIRRWEAIMAWDKG